MRLPGGPRSLSPFSLLTLLTLIVTSASAAVVGIDLGTEYIKATLVKPGVPLDIILTKDSKRKEAAAVAFKPIPNAKSSSERAIFPERAYGSDAVALSARFPGDSFQNIKTLLGIPFEDEAVGQYAERYPGAKLVSDKERGTVALVSAAFEEAELPFLVEELLAMELQNVAGNAEAMAGGQRVRDVVITVPAYWTVNEKDAVKKAAELAGLQVLSLTSDGLAVGVNYAMTRTFPVINNGTSVKPEYHVVYDMGAGGTTATVLRFQGRNVKDVGRFNKTVQEVAVLGVGWDETLGGDAMNTLILNDMIDQLADSPKIKALDGVTRDQIAKDGRTINKLWKEAERLRQVLSANMQTQASFEGLYHEDVTFKYQLKRADFEKMTENYAKRVRSPIDQAMHSARLEFSDIESLIVHGGAQRTPFVQKALEQVMGKTDKVRTNINSDEAAAFGAGFMGASMSSGFRVKDIRTSDIGVHDVWMSWNQEGKDKKQKIFTDSSKTGATKSFTFKHTDDFTFDIYQQVLDGSDMRNVPVWTVKSTNLTEATKQLTEKHGCAADEIKTQFDLWLNPTDGIPDVTKGTVSCEIVEDGNKGGIVDGIKGFFGGKKESDQKVVQDEAAEQGSSAEAESSTTSSEAAEATPVGEKAKEAKKKTHTLNVGFTTDAAARKQMSHMEVFRVRDRLKSFAKSDLNRVQRAEALNQLEGYTYRIRDMLENEGFITASTDAQRAEIAKKSSEASDWLYGDGTDADKEEFQTKLRELKALVEPIEKRKEESVMRPKQVDILEKTLESTRSLLDTLKGLAEQGVNEADSAASAASESISSVVESVTASPDAFAELEDESSSSSTTSSEKSIPTPLFKPEDFLPAYETLENTGTWLKERLAAQAKLSSSDEPALSVADIKAKANELSKLTTELMQKQLKMQTPGGSDEKKGSKSKSKSAKSKSKKNKTVKSSKGESITVGEESGTATVVPVEETISVKDEL